MKLEDLEIPITEFKGIGPKTALILEKNKIKTIKNLIFYFPYKYIDLSKIQKIKDVKIGENVVILGRITNIKIFTTPKRKMFLVQGIVSDETGSLKVIWYNQPYLAKILSGGPNLLLYGKLKKTSGGVFLQSPKFEIVKSKESFKGRIQPIYSEMQNLTTNFFEKIIKNILSKYDIKNLQDPLPDEILKKFNYPSLGKAIITLHQPKNLEEIELAKERLSFEELLYIQLALLLERKNLTHSKAEIFKKNEEITEKFLSQFNFKLTPGQEKVLDEIFNDLKKGIPMNRLLQGETGSGKTLIAEIISLNVAHSGSQVVFMAPTEILAQQHFERMVQHFSLFNIGLALITSGQILYAEKGYKAVKNLNFINRYLSLGKIKILIGTHSLIENELTFQKVGLVIIDEQQRFGVNQRKKLLTNTKQEFIPHFLTMTATPIPRTLALALYGDLDFSYLLDKPFGTKPVKTYIVLKAKEQSMWRFILEEIKKGHQAFVICPRVEEKEDDIASVKREYQRIKEIFKDHNVNIAILHGKMKSIEKEQILRKMQKNEINILVSSSVVEVGIDLPLATVIVILSPERFGLAQLYQLRGRVGRSDRQGYCFLFLEKFSQKAKLRLKYFLQAKSALELSEYDLKLRGAGELLGERQSGIPDLAMKSLTNLKLVEKVKKVAEEILNSDFKLEKYPKIKKEVYQKFSTILA